MESQPPPVTATATGAPATYRSPLLERRRRATLSATNPDVSPETQLNPALKSLSPSQRRLSQTKQNVSDLSFRLKSLFSTLGLAKNEADTAEEAEEVLDSNETIAIAELELGRARTTSAQRVGRRLSAKITAPSLSHAAYLLPSSTHSQSATPKQRPSVVEPHDFYNADFSNHHQKSSSSASEPTLHIPSTSASNIISISNKAGSLDLETAKHGQVFIEALNSMAHGQRTVKIDSAPLKDDEEPEITYTAPSKRVTPRSSTSSNISITLPIDTLKSSPTLAVKKTFAPQISSVDVSDMFPSDFLQERKTEGILVFRIENMRPEILEEEEHGRFCIADSYVIISTRKDNPHLQHYNPTTSSSTTNPPTEPDEISADHLIHIIYTWIGSLAEMDKRFCCAMFAVGVKNLLGVGTRVMRQAQGEETADFKALFPNGEVAYDDESFAAESGLFVAERRRYQLRVYRVSGKPHVRMSLVEPIQKSLESNNVYLIDAGHDLIQWNGKESCLTVRSKCRILTNIINGTDRVGKASVSEIEEGQNSEAFEKIFPRDFVGQEEGSFVEGNRVATIYRVPEDGIVGDLQELVIAIDENESGFSRTILSPKDCCILDAGVEIYLWIGSKATAAKKCFASEVLARVIRNIPTRPSYLSLQRITQHNEPEPFKLYFPDWIEQRITSHIEKHKQSLKARPTPLKVDVRALYAPHPLLDSPTGRTLSVSENRFLHASSLMETANQKIIVYNAFAFEKGRFVKLEDAERGGVHVCMEGQYAFLCVYGAESSEQSLSFPKSEDEATDAMNKALVLSGAHEEFRLGTHFPVVESYNSLASNSRDSISRKSDTSKCCVVYFWVGRAASKVSEKTFRFHARHELEEAIRELYQCSVQIVHVTQEREPLELLAHWGNRSVVHRGNRKDLLKRLQQQDANSDEGPKSVLYHMRTDWKYKTTRAIEVPCVSERLISRDCFYIHQLKSDPGVGFLWTGKNATKEDARKAHAVAERISSLYVFETFSEVTKRKAVAASSVKSSLNELNETSDDADDSVKEVSIKSKQSTLLTKRFRIVAEGLEPRAFFSLFPNGKQPYCTGPMPPLLVPESLLKPSVS
ncbi:UNVERIFIED_CONTAM: hypothetical protein HDU68_003095, partial [Siphonaria sp. JEL0065]